MCIKFCSNTSKAIVIKLQRACVITASTWPQFYVSSCSYQLFYMIMVVYLAHAPLYQSLFLPVMLQNKLDPTLLDSAPLYSLLL